MCRLVGYTYYKHVRNYSRVSNPKVRSIRKLYNDIIEKKKEVLLLSCQNRDYTTLHPIRIINYLQLYDIRKDGQ